MCYVVSLHFIKMNGTGNRIVVVDNRGKRFAVPDEDALRRMGDDTTGPGFDQLMWINPAQDIANVAAYRVFNSDGSEVEQCGNGLRCIASLLGAAEGEDFSLESPAGLVSARIIDDNTTAVSMGHPVFVPADVPFVADEESLLYAIEADGRLLEASVLSMGNPRIVLDVDDTATAPVETLGPLLEHHPRFPARVNVGFRRITARNHIDLRVWERGAGETLACGTGACAAVISGIRRGLLDDEVRVSLPGGEVVVSWRGEEAWLSGQVTLEYEGSFDL